MFTSVEVISQRAMRTRSFLFVCLFVFCFCATCSLKPISKENELFTFDLQSFTTKTEIEESANLFLFVRPRSPQTSRSPSRTADCKRGLGVTGLDSARHGRVGREQQCGRLRLQGKSLSLRRSPAFLFSSCYHC